MQAQQKEDQSDFVLGSAGRKPTDSLGEAVDSLAVGVRLVPDEGVGQVGLSWEPLLEEPAHHCHHQVHLRRRRRRRRRRGEGEEPQANVLTLGRGGGLPHLHQVEGDGRLSHGDLEDGFVPGRP